ncbi:MAG TPA: hypothetical protein VEU96_29150 [Bryobacteraceae bacterium]|nr:hypothetical protein [Bryobacteraceae bacterium]
MAFGISVDHRCRRHQPRFDRNPNTGRPVTGETVLKRAQQTVHHDRLYPSHVLLPVVPAPNELTSTSQARYGSKRTPAIPSKGQAFQAR